MPGVVASVTIPVLDVQENEGTFKQVSDDGKSKQIMQQKQ